MTAQKTSVPVRQSMRLSFNFVELVINALSCLDACEAYSILCRIHSTGTCSCTKDSVSDRYSECTYCIVVMFKFHSSGPVLHALSTHV